MEPILICIQFKNEKTSSDTLPSITFILNIVLHYKIWTGLIDYVVSLFIMTFPLLLICRCWKQCYYGGKTWCYTAQKWHYLGGVKCDASPNKTPEDKGEFCDKYGKVCITACYVGWKSDMNTMSEDRYFVSLIASFPPRPCDRLLSFKTNMF